MKKMAEIVPEFLRLKKYPDLNDIQKEAVKCGILDGKGNFWYSPQLVQERQV